MRPGGDSGAVDGPKVRGGGGGAPRLLIVALPTQHAAAPMPDSAREADAWLDRFFRSYHRHRPVSATFIGAHEHDHRLPDRSEEGAGDALADAEALLATVDDLLDRAGGARAMDLRLARGFLRAQRWELEGGHVHRGNPSWYTGEAVFGFLSLFLNHGGALPDRAEAARARLDAVPRLLGQGREQLRQAPVPWTERAVRECRGALALFGEGVDALAEELGLEPDAFRQPADRARQAVSDHLAWLETELRARPRPEVAAGEDALELYLRDGHFLPDSPDQMVAYAREELAVADAWLREHAADFGADSVEGALAGLADRHPSVEEYLPRYRRVWEEVRARAEKADVLTWPDFPIRYRPRPPWVREAAPWLYFLFYRSPAAFHRPPVHEYLVTPIEADLSADRREALLRSHNDSVIKLNHVVHHGGIGHHVQNWHAFRAESRVGRMAAVDCASRIAMTCGGTMAEGWACYATDLVAELGGLTPLERYAERHGRVRMCARAIVDLELHRGRMGLEEAASFYRERAGMSQGAARSEAVKNSMFPGGAVMYLMGTDAIHRLRAEMSRREGSAFRLGRFHDTFLSYGSVPVSLIARDMLRASEEPQEIHAQ